MTSAWAPVHFERTGGAAPIVLVCEHASHFIPPEFEGLGLDEAAGLSHAAWDIGAADMARELSRLLDAPLALGGVSRLLFDCNRPPTAHDCIPAKSEVIEVPGNVGLSDAERRARAGLIHDPFHAGVAGLIDARRARPGGDVVLVTLHTFTPVYFGQRREVQIGFLHDGSDQLSRAALAVEVRRGTYRAALNEPYAADDGVTYTLARHAEANGLPSIMIEVRNDLADTPEKARVVANHLAETLTAAVSLVQKDTVAVP